MFEILTDIVLLIRRKKKVKPGGPLARLAAETRRKERAMKSLTSILTGLAFGAALLSLTATATGQETTEPTAETEAAAAEAEAEVEEVSEQLEVLGVKIDLAGDKAAATAGGTPAGAVDPNLQALLDHKVELARAQSPPKFEDGVVAIIVPIAFFAMIVLMVFLPLYLRNRRRALESEVQRGAIEAGLQFIPELPAAPLKKRNDRRTGLILAGIGVAAAVPLALVGLLQAAAFGLAPVVLGIVYFVVGTLLPSPATSD
jgi:hypothetical protein